MTPERIPPEYERIWHALDDLSPEPISPAALDRIQHSLDALVPTLNEMRGTMTVTRKVFAAAAGVALLIGGVAGFSVASARSPQPTGEASHAAARSLNGEGYLLLVHDTEGTERAVREAGMPAIVAEYAAWAGGLASQGKLVSAEKLRDTAAWVGRDPSSASPVSGFFLIRADTPEEALKIARESPHARYGGVVEVRAINPTGE